MVVAEAGGGAIDPGVLTFAMLALPLAVAFLVCAWHSASP